MAKYDNIDFTPTDAMAAEGKRGLAWRKEFKRGGTAIGVARASQLARKEKLSPSTVKRMHSYFSRHEVDKQGKGFNPGEGYPSAGRIAWALWGGDAGQAWARKRVRQMEAADQRSQADLAAATTPGVRESLKQKADEHNKKYSDTSKRTTVATLIKVFNRGVGAYKTNPRSVRPQVNSPEQWAFARVNSFLFVLRNGRYRSGKHDTDLLPKGHPMKDSDEKKSSLQADMGYYEKKQRKSKALDATDEMLAQIERITGTAVSADDIVIFEAEVANTMPLNKAGSIFNKGRIAQQTLVQMADALNSGAESVPLHTLHQQGMELPVGRVFQGEVAAKDDGSYALRAMFYIAKSETQLIERINLGILDEVSIGVKSQALMCSKCGFDYFGADADYNHLFSQTCSNGHTVGVDGTHVELVGLDKWMELSLVSRGASSKPKILSRAKELMPREVYDRIAADMGLPPEAVFLFTASDDVLEGRTGNPEYDNQGEMAKSQMRMVLEAAQEIHDMLGDEDPLPGHVIEKVVLATTYLRDARDYLKSEMAKEENMTDTPAPVEPSAAEFDAQAAIADLAAQLAELKELIIGEFDDNTDEAPEIEGNVENLESADEAVALKAELDAAKARIAELEATSAPIKEEVTIDLSGIPVGGVAASAVEDAARTPVKPALNAFKSSKR